MDMILTVLIVINTIAFLISLFSKFFFRIALRPFDMDLHGWTFIIALIYLPFAFLLHDSGLIYLTSLIALISIICIGWDNI